MQKNSEFVIKFEKERELQLLNWDAKKHSLQKQQEKKTLDNAVITSLKGICKDERMRMKADVKDVSKNKVITRHSDVNGQISSNNKHKNSFKRKMST